MGIIEGEFACVLWAGSPRRTDDDRQRPTGSRVGEKRSAMSRQLDVVQRGWRPIGRGAREQRLAVDLSTFERKRLALFARYGFAGESRWVTDREGRTTYMIGRGEGPCPTLLIHGGLSEASEWALLAGRMPGHVIIPDRPGCGLSQPSDYRGVDYRKAADSWLRGLVDGIGTEQVDLVGNSMGGFFAMAFALAHPDRVRRLILPGSESPSRRMRRLSASGYLPLS